MERATRERLDNTRGPDQLTVVLDARDASTLQVTRKVTLFKDTAVALNQVRPPLSTSLVCGAVEAVFSRSYRAWLCKALSLGLSHAIVHNAGWWGVSLAHRAP